MLRGQDKSPDGKPNDGPTLGGVRRIRSTHNRTPSHGSQPGSPAHGGSGGGSGVSGGPQSPQSQQEASRERMFFLFNDLLLETKPQGKEGYRFKAMYPMSKLRVVETETPDEPSAASAAEGDESGRSFTLLVDLESDRQNFTKLLLTAPSKSVALSWISDFMAAKEELKEEWECTQHHSYFTSPSTHHNNKQPKLTMVLHF